MNKNERTWFFNSCHEINILVDFSVSHVSSSQLRKQNTRFDSISEYYQLCDDDVTHSVIKKHFSHGLEYKYR